MGFRAVYGQALLGCVSALVVLLGSVVRAEDRYFNGLPSGGTGDWSTTGAWSGGVLPSSQDTAWILDDDEFDRTITSTVPISVGSLNIGNSGGGLTTFRQSNDLTVANEILGLGLVPSPEPHYVPSARATHIQDGGNAIMGSLLLAAYNGFRPPAVGRYVLNAGNLTANYVTVGDSGEASFKQNGGIASIDTLWIAYKPESNAAFTLADGTLTVNSDANVGYGGNGTFLQLGGTSIVNRGLYLGTTRAAIGQTTGRYILSGTDAVLLTNTVLVGDHTAGWFEQSAGFHESQAGVAVGYLSVGTYEMSGGTLNIHEELDVGLFASGTFLHTGGTVTVGTKLDPADLLIGETDGFYALSGNTAVLNVWGDEYTGDIGRGVFIQSAGTHFINGSLRVMGNGILGSYSRYALQGGSLQVTDSINIGWFGKGSFMQSGGSLSASSVVVSQNGHFTHTGGSFSIGDLVVEGQFTLAPSLGHAIRFSSLAIASGTAKFDLDDNAMIIDGPGATSPLKFVELGDALAAGALFNSVAGWNQRIGYADNNVLKLTSFAGETFPAGDFSQLLVQSTYAGDANLDGRVDRTDLEMLAASWLATGFWTAGDFDYDGLVTKTDLQLLAWNWQDASDLQQALTELGLPPVVPEPVSGGAIAIMAAALHRGHRRNHLSPR